MHTFQSKTPLFKQSAGRYAQNRTQKVLIHLRPYGVEPLETPFFFATLTVFWRVDGDMAWSLEQSLLNFVDTFVEQTLNFNRLYAIWTFFSAKKRTVAELDRR